MQTFQNISLQDLEDLQADIKVYKDLDKNKTEQTFWEDLEVVCVEQIKQNKKKIKVSLGFLGLSTPLLRNL